MIHEILPVGMLQCNCSIFGDETTREAMVVDPGDEIASILEIVSRHGLTVKAIVITHAHIDHIGGAQKLKQATGAPVYMNLERHGTAADDGRAGDVAAAWRRPRRWRSTCRRRTATSWWWAPPNSTCCTRPGHTQGSICLWMPSEGKLVAGDTLFRESIGRTDLPGGDGRQILQSIHDKLLPLPGETEVIPGHGENTTIDAREGSSTIS